VGPGFAALMESVNHPAHYNQHPSGVEAVDLCEQPPFNLGNSLKYLWRADHKGKASEDREKAVWYLKREIDRRPDGGLVCLVPVPAMLLARRVYTHEPEGTPLGRLLDAIGSGSVYASALERAVELLGGKEAA
jgi:hypothetical protein